MGQIKTKTDFIDINTKESLKHLIKTIEINYNNGKKIGLGRELIYTHTDSVGFDNWNQGDLIIRIEK